MRFCLLLAVFAFGVQCVSAFTQNTPTDSSILKQDRVKKGFNLGAIPALAFDTDLGLQYGAIANLYHYGDGANYPRYNHSLFVQYIHSSKGSNEYQAIYDSEHLIEGLRVNAEALYMEEPLLEFFGFNGYNAWYNRNFEDKTNTDYISRAFYRYNRSYVRLRTDFHGNIFGRKFRWLAGINHYDIKTGSVNVRRLNKGKPDADKLPSVPVLFDKYVEWGLISADEKDGGITNQLKAGLIYDTRDNEPNPMAGLWSEAILVYAPSFIDNKHAYSDISLTHRQYFTILPTVLNFAYRVGYHAKLWGDEPYYMLPFINFSNNVREGLGGAKTVRGIKRNRVESGDLLYTNLELRWKFWRGYKYKQNFYTALTGFTDAGLTTRKYKVSTTSTEGQQWLDKGSAETFHPSVGLGLYVAMNQNFVVAFNYGKALNPKDGDSGIYINLDFLF